MRFFLDISKSEQTGEAILSLGNEPGGQVVATLPYKTQQDMERAALFALLPQAFEQIEEFRGMWFYHGDAEFECGMCHAKNKIPGADDSQVGRLERLRMKIT